MEATVCLGCGAAVGFEDLFHLGRVGGAGNCLISADEALEIGICDAVVHRLHTEFAAGLDDVGDFIDAVFAMQLRTADVQSRISVQGTIPGWSTRRNRSARLRPAGCWQALFESGLLARGIYIDDTLNGLSCVNCVQG